MNEVFIDRNVTNDLLGTRDLEEVTMKQYYERLYAQLPPLQKTLTRGESLMKSTKLMASRPATAARVERTFPASFLSLIALRI